MRPLLILAVLASAELLQAQTYTDLHDFNSTDGCCANYPSMMAQAQDGSIWGATTSGGASFQGNIFKITPSGTFTDVHDFVFAQGSGPQGGISMGMDGNFYGTTYEGGSHSAGTVFKITPSGTFTDLYDFTNGADGGFPRTLQCRQRTGTSMAQPGIAR
jgi:uncharacterized repeat protein (TIGR03803 family)